jgi:hypothetical protein
MKSAWIIRINNFLQIEVWDVISKDTLYQKSHPNMPAMKRVNSSTSAPPTQNALSPTLKRA